MKRYRFITFLIVLFTVIMFQFRTGHDERLIANENLIITDSTVISSMASDSITSDIMIADEITANSMISNSMIAYTMVSSEAITNETDISNETDTSNATDISNETDTSDATDVSNETDASVETETSDKTDASNENEQQEYTYIDISNISDNIPIYEASNTNLSKSPMRNLARSENNLYGYSKLSETMQGYYDLLDNAFSTFLKGDYRTKDYTTNDPYVTLFGIKQSGVTEKDLMKVYWTYKNDHPEYYWISNYYSYNTINKEVYVYILMDKSYVKAADRIACDTLITNGIANYINAVNQLDKKDDYEIIRTVHDMLIESVDYAYNSSNKPETSIWAHNIIGIFSKKGVVCEGYAKTFQLILNKLDIKNVYIIGYAGEAHAWNYVCIDEKYYAVDVTWDDMGMEKNGKYGGMMYQYFCMPGNYFKTSHTPYTKSGDPLTGKWLYDLPTLENDMENTYYKKYDALASNINNSNASDFISKASANAPGDYIQILSDSTSLSYITSALGVNSYIPVKNYGNYTALLIKENYKIQYPATSISLTSTSLSNNIIEVNRDEQTGDISLTVVLKSEGGTCDDKVTWSASSSIVQIDGSSTTVKLIPKRNGTATITAKAVKGGVSATCTIIISSSSDAYGIYQDSEYTKSILEDDVTIWVNGGNVNVNNTRYNYKKALLYTDLTPSNITTIKNGKATTKSGKLIVGVTMSSEQPKLSNGKIVDNEASKIAKATIKNGVITLTAQKQSGLVYVWVIDTGDDGKSGYAPITVKISPSKITITEKQEVESAAFTKITIPINTKFTFYLQPTIDRIKTKTEDATYYVTSADKTASCVEINQTGDTAFQLSARSLLNGKATKAKITAYCNQNTKKASITVTINNPVLNVSPTLSAYSFSQKNDIITVMLNETTYSDIFQTTMKPAIYIMTEPNLTLNEAYKLQGTKAKEITARLSTDKKSFTLTLKKAPADVATDHHIYIFYKEGKECKLFYIGYIDKNDLTFKSTY